MRSEHAPEFPVTECAVCAKQVLCYTELDDEDCELLRCIGCASLIDPAAVRWLDLHGIEDLGYGYVLPEGGCGRPGCGNGQCGRAAPRDE